VPVGALSATGTPSASTWLKGNWAWTSIGESDVVSLVSDLAGKQASGNYLTALTGDGTASGPGSVALTVTKTNGVSFAASATTDTTNASNITSGTLPAGRLPNPSASTLGGVESLASVSHQFLTSISTSGVPTQAQPAASDVSGLAASATTDTTNASNITSGTLPAARLPNPSASTLGGVESLASVSHQFLTSISTSGVPTQAQPAASDVSGLAASATTDTTNASNITSGTLPAGRLPNPSSTTLGGVESLASVSHQFLTSISTSGVPTQAQPAASDVSGLAASATTDTTNASNITSGTLPTAQLAATTNYRYITFVFGNGGSALATGLCNATCAFHGSATLVAVYLMSPDSTSGSATVDIVRANAAIPTSANSIVGGGGTKPALSSATYAKDTTFTSWTSTTISDNDVFEPNLTAVTSLKYLSVTLVLQVS